MGDGFAMGESVTVMGESSAISRALDHLASRQSPDGCWEGEVVWNSMLLSQYVIVTRIIGPAGGAPAIDEPVKQRMIHHYRVTCTPEGAWGMHPDSGPYVFFTAMAYVALRLLGLGPDDPLTAGARRWLRAQPGGVRAIPSWGKFWLAMLGLYGYEGVNPVAPELFVLPERLPVHPSRYYCHTRYIYLAIAYLYGRRFRADLGPITAALRSELYDAPYESIDFAAHRHDIAATDLYVRPGRALRVAYDALSLYERVHSRALRRRALAHCFERILYEVRTSRHQGLSPVNGLLNCLALHAEDPSHPDLAPSLRGVEAWRWDDEAEGIRYAGARSNAWDTAFVLRASLEVTPELQPAAALRRAYGFLRETQITSELPGYREERRDPALGGWCFSDGQHRWPVSDCTAEALSSILAVHATPGLVPSPADRISRERIRLAAEFILARQNDDGGFGTYEQRRGGAFLESLNPSEMYGSCMTERSYLECTASSIGALARLRAAHPELLRSSIDSAVDRGARLLRDAQRPDGSWPGFWGINFTYATFHVVEALRAVGAKPDDPAIARAAVWLRSKQRSDGSWGEHYTSCLEGRYVEHSQGQVIMTSWALLALLLSDEPGSDAVRRGVAWLTAMQQPDGSWPRQAVAGVFFGTAMLDYRLYKDYFPLWALARAAAA